MVDQLKDEAPGQIPPALVPLIDSLKQVRPLDPRFRFLDDLGQFQKEVIEISQDLQKRDPAKVEEAAGLWSKKFETRKAEITDEIKAAKTVRPALSIVLGTLVTTIVSGILSEVGKAAWHIISPK